MPELPEVETIRRGLENIVGKKITNIFRSEKKLRLNSSLDFQALKGAKISKISRRARYLIINFSDGLSLIIHLGMSGRITLEREFKRLKHDHFACEFNDETCLVFNDPRRFGFVDLIKTKNLSKHKMLTKLGPEPLEKEFDFADFSKKLSRKKTNIKTTIMDNQVVVGVGNIYANESLFDSGISPLRKADSLTKNEIEKLISSIKKIIKAAIKSGGSSISDYVDSQGNFGHFQDGFRTYGRSGEKCLQCKNPIQRISQSGRSSFFCNQCQK
ncbi:MAG: bifunctional DNA-formamidopyrimidine glycosylase/DNA-(apurinic or apyrimidinic site) lyase [Proteobacteria bacterium]|nr:bifunctional DNA-formamidopyrimidine glycosylase/DNA-(apurinic or apyrimidinic site) lyase [Pseudomonadota bacterium]